MKARSLFALAALSLALVAKPAFSIAPALIWAYGASIAAHVGLIYSVWRVPVHTDPAQTTPPIEVVFIQDPEVTPEKVAQEYGKSPATTVANQRAPDTTFTATFGTATVTGSTPQELQAGMAAAAMNSSGLPQVPVGFSHFRSQMNVTGSTNLFRRDIATGASTLTMTVTGTRVNASTFTAPWCGQVSCTFTATFTADKEFVCPQGYVYSTTSNTQCTLQDPVAAKSAPTIRDEICAISREGVPNPFDPDCAELQGKGVLSTGTANGAPAASIRDPKTGQTVGTYNNGDGSKGMSVTTPTPGGGHNQQVVKTDPTGKISDPSASNKEDPAPAPSNPYQPGGTCDKATGPIPSWCGGGIDSSSGCTSNCGNTTINNPGTGGTGTGLTGDDVKNGVKDGVGEALKTTGEKSIGEQDGDINADIPDATDGIFDKFLAFKAFTIQDPGYSCTYALDLGTAGATTLNFSMFGNHSIAADMNLNKVCPLIEPHEQQIQTLALALWSIAAILLFIRLTV